MDENYIKHVSKMFKKKISTIFVYSTGRERLIRSHSSARFEIRINSVF